MLVTSQPTELKKSKAEIQIFDTWSLQDGRYPRPQCQNSWFAFDLDDIMHSFRGASNAASSSVFSAIHSKHNLVAYSELANAYITIRERETANAFADGLTSSQYRKKRFAALLGEFMIPFGMTDLEELADMYKHELEQTLQPKPGALEHLERLKAKGKKVMIVREGPQDAQEWTVEKVGLAPYIDVVVNTNEMRLAKVDGPFEAILQIYDIEAADMVYFGDNWRRDVELATKAGILSILYYDKGGSDLETVDDVICVPSLAKIVEVLESK